ncbi:MAG: tRNA-dihydrouridine synthase [Acidobacteria bacterium]|nr:tRNA-dihydrouridine synthase [Acidobacteriota bacterium]
MKPFKIRDIEINPPLILSPMAGVTDYTFRRLIKRRGGVGLVVSEFISVEGLTRHNPKSKRQMRFDEESARTRCRSSAVSRNGCGSAPRWPKRSALTFLTSIAVAPRRRSSNTAAVQGCFATWRASKSF